MNRYVFGFVVMAIVGGAVLADEKSDAEVKKLEGTWDIDAIESMGKKIPAPAGKGGSIVFSKDMKVVMKDPKKADQPGTYTIDAGKTPKQLDLIEKKEGDKKGEVMQAIYHVDGDKLRMGFSAKGPKGERPKDFDGKETVIMHLKRQKS
jgi:uncharacterized protein (TIGR03067 family)